MKHIMTMLAIATVALLVAGCGEKGISTARLEKSFRGADTTAQNSVTAITKAVQERNFGAAAAELQKLGAQATLTPD